LVLHHPHITRNNLPQSLAGIEQVLTVRLLGVIFQSSLSFAAHVDYVLKVCSQRMFLLKQLRAQGMPLEQLHTVFQAIILQCLAYAVPAWGPFLSVDLKHKTDGFLKRSYRYGFTKEMFHIQSIIDSVMYDLFDKVKASNHCLYHLLPPQRPLHNAVRVRGYQFQLPNCIYKFHKKSFILSSLFRFLKYFFLDWFFLFFPIVC